MAIINNVSYSWAMIQLSAPALTGTGGSTVLNGVSAIKYSIKQNVKPNYGLGGRRIMKKNSNIECTASITMDYNTQVELRNMCGSLRNLGEFDLVISFGNFVGEGEITEETVTLKGCIFNEDGFEANQDDTNLTHEFDLNPYDIVISSATGA